MKANILIYIAANFLLIHITRLDNAFADLVLNTICVLGIITLGIAHGSIDNVLYGTESRKSNLVFIIRYVAVISLFAMLWLVLPNFAFITFVLVSCYHFGQSQHAEYLSEESIVSKILFFVWGGLVISLMLYLNGDEILLTENVDYDFYQVLIPITQHSVYYLMVFAVLYFGLQFYLLSKEKMSWGDVLKEVYIIGLLSISLSLFPAFVAFSLFFVFIHSMKVIMQEFDYCKSTERVSNRWQFVSLFLPLASISVLFTLAVVGLLLYFGQQEFMPYVLLVLLSCVTIPHAFVMEKFYSKLSLGKKTSS